MRIPESLKKTHPLYDSEIEEFLDENDIVPYKIYSRNEKKETIPSGEFYCVINLDDMDGGGTHWTGMYSDGDKAYYYDPFGMECPVEIIDWVKKKNKMKLFYIDNQHQPTESNLCGYYVCLFLFKMDEGMDIEKFMDMFEDGGKEGNDTKLLSIFGIGKDKKVADKKEDVAMEPIKGKGFDLVGALNSVLPNVELHLHDIKFNDFGLPTGFQKHSFTGPNTNLTERISNIDELMKLPRLEDITYDKIQYITPPIDESIDRYASVHDLQYSWGKANARTPAEKLKDVHSADKILQDNAYKTMRDGKAPIQKRIQGALVSLTMLLKRKIGLGVGQSMALPELEFLNTHRDKLNKKQIKILNSLRVKK